MQITAFTVAGYTLLHIGAFLLVGLLAAALATGVAYLRALEAGGRLVSDREAPSFWVLADPEGNEFCAFPRIPER